MAHSNKVLVTGANGFIGSHLVEKLALQGYDVRAFCHYNSLNSWGWLDTLDSDLLNRIEVHSGDIRDFGCVSQSVKDCSTILHLAALIGIPYSYTAPDSYIDTNVKGTLNLLNAASRESVGRFIHTSTSEVYGSAVSIPIHENHPLQPQSPYSASKIAADQIALSYYYSFGLPVTILRPFNTFGPRQSARAVIPTVISQIAAGSDTIKLGSLDTSRDFNYVLDTVNGFISACTADKIAGETINLGSSYEITIAKAVDLIASLMNQKVNIEMDQFRVRPETSEVLRLCADNEKARKFLNWEPQLSGKSGLITGLEKTINWFTKPDNLKRYKVKSYNI